MVGTLRFAHPTQGYSQGNQATQISSTSNHNPRIWLREGFYFLR